MVENDSNSVKRLYFEILQKKANHSISSKDLLQQVDELFKNIDNTADLKLDAELNYDATLGAASDLDRSYRGITMDEDKFINFILEGENANTEEFAIFIKYMRSTFYGVSFFEQLNLYTNNEISNKKIRTKLQLDNNEMKIASKAEKSQQEDISISITKKIKKKVIELGKVELYMLVLDPNSYSKTIENIFYMSFALKLGFISLEWKDEKIYVVPDRENGGSKEHFIFTIEESEYNELNQKFGLKEAILK